MLALVCLCNLNTRNEQAQQTMLIRTHTFFLSLRFVALPHERPPSWLKVDLQPPPPGHPAWDSQQGKELLHETFQAALDELRDRDLRAKAATNSKGGRGREQQAQGRAEGADKGAAAPEPDAAHGPGPGPAPGATGHAGAAADARSSTHSRSTAAAGRGSHTAHAGLGRMQSLDWSDVSAFGRALQQPQAGRDTEKCMDDADEAEEGVPYGYIDLSTITRLVLRLDRVVRGEACPPLVPHGCSSVLFEVLTEPPDYDSTDSLDGRPVLHSVRPAHDAALAALRCLRQQPAVRNGSGAAGGDGGPRGAAAAQEQWPAGQQAGDGTSAPDAQGQQQPAQQQQQQQQQQEWQEQEQWQGQQQHEQRKQQEQEEHQQQQQGHSGAGGLAGFDEIQPASSVPYPSAGNGSSMAQEPAPASSGDLSGAQPPAAVAASVADLPVLSVEFHSRPPHDYYFATAFVDFLSFVYLALFYQVGSANEWGSSWRQHSTLTDAMQQVPQHLVPV